MSNTAILQEFDAISPLEEMAAYEALWDEDAASVKRISDRFKSQGFLRPSNLVSKEKIKQYIDEMKKRFVETGFHFDVCCATMVDFPQKLFDATHAIPFLYYAGLWDLMYAPSVAVVGTRNPSSEGISRTQKLVQHLVSDGYTIVSGLASGIDTAAHEATISLGGSAIAVIGTPMTQYYPQQNELLQKKIAQEHLLISQVPFIKCSKQDPKLNRFFFPERNKTMSAISKATVIVEAGETSGTLIQAREALKQNRKLFILDSCFQNKALTWPEYFQKKGAVRVKSYEDIRIVLNDTK